MKSKKSILYSFITIITLSCSSDNDSNGNNLANFRSQLCATVTGPTAAYWDYSNSLPISLTQVPVLKNTSGQFIHSQHPYLGFPMPQGYTAFEASDPQTVPLGVNVIRNDNQVIWRYVPLQSFPVNFSINDIIGREINQMFSAYNFNGNFEILCSQPTQTENLGGILRSFTARLIRFGNFTGLVWVHVITTQGLPTHSVAASVSVGPSNEYDNLVMNTFLPLSFQLLVNDRDTLSDRDGDGTPDVYDREPDNPNVQ